VNAGKLFDEHRKLQDFKVLNKESKLNVSSKYVKFFSEVQPKCPNLEQLISLVLSIPCTNAHSERIFSLMQQVWTDQRNT
jgi:hypothetical protein